MQQETSSQAEDSAQPPPPPPPPEGFEGWWSPDQANAGGDDTDGAAGDVAQNETAADSASAQAAGCYLVWEDHNQGSLCLHWSRSTIDHALAVFCPKAGVTVPEFKYKAKGGKSTLKESATKTGIHVKRYMQGWTEFVKQARQNNARLKICAGDEMNVAVHLCQTEAKGAVVHVRPNEWYDVSRISGPPELAVAVVSSNCATFDGIQAMDMLAFVQKGNKERAGAALFCDKEGRPSFA